MINIYSIDCQKNAHNCTSLDKQKIKRKHNTSNHQKIIKALVVIEDKPEDQPSMLGKK
jgi:hypothetical protein